jgi:hypothetical protein
MAEGWREWFSSPHMGALGMDIEELDVEPRGSELEPRELTFGELDDASGGFNINIPTNWIWGILICRQ